MGPCLVSIATLLLLGVPYAESQGLLNATDYKWKDVVLDQVPGVSNSCMSAIRQCTGFPYMNLEHSLLYDDKERTSNCGDTSEENCLREIKKNRRELQCIPITSYRVFKFFCYKYSASDNAVPPISTSCAMRLWKCSKVNLPLYDLIPPEEKKEMCDNNIVKSCFPWYYSTIMFKYVWDRVKEIEDYMCRRSIEYQSSFKSYEHHILKCYGDRFNLFKLLTELKSLDKQHYMCGRLQECLAATVGVKDWDCGKTEAKVAGEFICSGTNFSSDAYGLFRISEQCKKSFQESCSNYTMSRLEADLDLRQRICRTRTQPLDNCLSASHCNLNEDTIPLGNFLCFSPHDPVLLLHDGCVDNFKHCYWNSNKEGLSFYEMDVNVHFKSTFCTNEYDDDGDSRQCLKKRISKLEDGCTRNELKIIHDFLCGTCFYETSCTSYRNSKHLYNEKTRQELKNTTDYKWLSIVQDQLPKVSQSCREMLHHCYGLTFHELLFAYDEKRMTICRGEGARQCLEHKSQADQKMCTRIEVFRIQMFFCYKYNKTNEITPPVSIPCVMRYWQCSEVHIPFIERIPVAHREQMCNSAAIFDDCKECLWKSRFEKQALMVRTYLCNVGNVANTTRISLWRSSQLCLQECYAMHFDILKLLSDLKSLSEQKYMCGHQEECLASAHSRLGFDEDVVCKRGEAKAIDEFMCNGTAFTPDKHGVFKVSEKCRKSFKDDCYNYTLEHLLKNAETRGKVCRDSSTALYDCLDTSVCNLPQDAKYLGDFLCFGENDKILKITYPCVRKIAFCYGIPTKTGFSYFEMSSIVKEKTDFCVDMEIRGCLFQTYSDTDDVCNDSEMAIINDYLCSSGGDVAIRKSLVVAFFVFEIAALSVTFR